MSFSDRRMNHGITVLYHPHQCRTLLSTKCFVLKFAISGKMKGMKRCCTDVVTYKNVL